MKKCTRCTISYKKDDRSYCIFYNGLLPDLNVDQIARVMTEQAQREKLTRSQAKTFSLVDHRKGKI
ncbi:MAG: hypothetical protein P9M07_02275 [Candidatus Aceula meridiana]|nr:hypothetical protein [Candidatus Aceula meridiana]